MDSRRAFLLLLALLALGAYLAVILRLFKII